VRRTVLFGVAVLSLVACASEDVAKWIWCPGDYALWRGNELQARRLEHGGGYPTFWASYNFHPAVQFRKHVKLAQPEVVDIAVEGAIRFTGHNDFAGVTSNKFVFPAGDYQIVASVFNGAKPPALYLNGPTIKTDSSWEADWRMSGCWSQPGVPAPAAECEDRFASADKRPGDYRLPTRPEKAVSVLRDGNRLFADFGRETFGFVKLLGANKAGRVRVIYGESEPEARELDPMKVDSWEFADVPAAGDFRMPLSRGFRYVHVLPETEGLSFKDVAMDFEWLPLEKTGSFRCDNERLNKIWDVSAWTLGLTLREIPVEGAKRDRWTWSGDAYQSYLMNYYLYGDRQLVKDAIWYLRGGDPVVAHVNHIMDYTFYWFMSIRDYWLFTGDKTFLEQAWGRMVSLMDFAIARLDKCGRPHNAPGDWMFIDWAPEPLHNTGGVTSFEQMLFVRALEAMAEVGDVVGASKKLVGMYKVRAQKLKLEVLPLFWSAEKGALMHLLKDDGKLDEQLTRYPNMFGLAWGYFDDAQRASVLKNVIFNDKVMKIQTPYMRFYELESLCTLGRQADVMKTMLEYWGGMLDEGATSFWELYNTDEKGLAKYAMYGRPYGKSLCHAWGASPIYLLGRYYLGVEPTKPGFAEYVVKPCLGGLKWMEGDVPTPSGPVHVRVDASGVSVTGNAGVGKLVWNGKEATVPARATVTLK